MAQRRNGGRFGPLATEDADTFTNTPCATVIFAPSPWSALRSLRGDAVPRPTVTQLLCLLDGKSLDDVQLDLTLRQACGNKQRSALLARNWTDCGAGPAQHLISRQARGDRKEATLGVLRSLRALREATINNIGCWGTSREPVKRSKLPRGRWADEIACRDFDLVAYATTTNYRSTLLARSAWVRIMRLR